MSGIFSKPKIQMPATPAAPIATPPPPPAPEPPPVPTLDVAVQGQEQADKLRRRRGRASTILVNQTPYASGASSTIPPLGGAGKALLGQ